MTKKLVPWKISFFIISAIASALLFADTGSAVGPCEVKEVREVRVYIEKLPYTESGTVDRGCFGMQAWSLNIKHWPPSSDEVDFFELKPLIQEIESKTVSCSEGQTECNQVPLILPFTLVGHYEYGGFSPVYTLIAVATCNHSGSFPDTLGNTCGPNTWWPKCTDFDPFIGTTYSEGTCGGKFPQKHYLYGQGPPSSCGTFSASWYTMCVDDFTSCAAIGMQSMGVSVHCKDCSSGCPY